MTYEARKDVPVGRPGDVTLEINYRGVSEKGKSVLEYKGGESRTVWPVDADLLSYFEVKGLAEDVDFTNIEDVYYVIPWLSMEDGIRLLKTYYNSLDMAECAGRAKKISAYIVHKMGEPVVIPPAVPTCEAEKETYTSKQPKSAYGKRVKHVAIKRINKRPHLKLALTKSLLQQRLPLQMLKFQAQGKIPNLKPAKVQVQLKLSSLVKALLQQMPQVRKKRAPLLLLKHKVQNRRSPLYQQKPNNNLLITLRMIGLTLQSHGMGSPRINPQQPSIEPKPQQMPIISHAQRGRGKTTSRGKATGRGMGRGRGRATGRGTGRERTTTNDNASTSGATSMVNVEVVHFLSQTSVGNSCLPLPSRD
ncbi:hypothetical protein Cgig2_020717 [Carnegiea gigantea]|uniref:PB1-like domain-containing protein n=1 Tax=Carnegiea gigantea TaxID=171969 RepID=A0A9Q1GU26_9CARY|nr:hypothetical protein Cgig2_020717 [Carnegiea gigantea]